MKNDYNLAELKRIAVRGLKFNIMPRYEYHYVNKDYEKFSLDLIDRLVRPGSTVIDIGAHYGIYSLLAAKKAKKVYAFEPVPQNFEIFQKNIVDNGFKNIVAINKAISNKDGKAEFHLPWASDSAGFYDHPNAKTMRTISVKTARIDHEITEGDISFIKIDTEGHELHVLDGMAGLLRRNKRASMLIELNPECLANAGSSPEALISKVIALEYDIFAIHESTRDMVRVVSTTSLDQIMRGEQYLNLLCLPKDSWMSVVLASHSASLGGAEQYLHEMIRDLISVQEKLVLLHVVLPGKGPLFDLVECLPIASQVVVSKGWLTGDDTSLALDELDSLNVNALASFCSIYRDFQPQVVLTNTLLMPWAAIAAKLFAIPHIWAIHEFGDKDHGLRFNEGFAETLAWVDSLSDRVLTTSDAVYRYVEKHISPHKLGVFMHGLQKPIIAKKLPRVYGNTAQLRLAVSGRIMPSKGQLDAVHALKLLRDEGYAAELLLLGAEGPADYIQKIKHYIAQHVLENFVHIVGHVENPYDYISQADIYLMCSQSEAFGRVTIEAMLLAKPVIGVNAGATPDIVQDGKTGYLYKAGNVQELTRHVRKLADDAKLCQAFGKAGYKAVEARYLKNNTLFWYDVLHKAASQKQRESSLLGGLGRGLSLMQLQHRQEIQRMVEGHQKDIKEFSDSYNKVYEAYHILERRLTRRSLSAPLRRIAGKVVRRVRKSQ